MHSKRIGQSGLVGLGLIILAFGTGRLSAHDGLLLAAVVFSVGLVAIRPTWAVSLAGVLVVSAGLLWSALDLSGCSVGSRARLYYEKLAGHLPYLGWREVTYAALHPCLASPEGAPNVGASIRLVDEKTVDGKRIERYETGLGDRKSVV